MIEQLLPILLFAIMLLLGMPIAAALGISGIFGIFVIGGVDQLQHFVTSAPHARVTSFSLIAIPMFVLMAELASSGRIVGDLFKLADRMLSRIKVGLALAVVASSALVGALSGSSVAATGAMARLALPELEQKGYSDAFAIGLVASAGTLAVLIPPSIPLVFFGIISGTSIAGLLLAGVVPGIMTAVAYFLVILVRSKSPGSFPTGANQRTYSLREIWQAARGTLPFLLVILVVVGGMYSGLMTAAEASAGGALATLLIVTTMALGRRSALSFAGRRASSNRSAAELSSHVRLESADPDASSSGQQAPGPTPADRDLSVTDLRKAFDNTLRTTSMIMSLIIGGSFFGFYLVLSGNVRTINTIVLSLESRILILVVALLAFLFLGMFLNQLTVLILAVPIFLPIFPDLGVHPVLFGILATKLVEIGLVSPPLGLNVYVATGAVPGKRLEDGFKGIVPFLFADLAVIFLLVLFPDIALYLPRRAGVI